MIRRKDDQITVSKNIREGIGDVQVTELMKADEFCEKGRLFSKMTVKPGNSIGKHMHTGDFEAYYILKGEGKYLDNGIEKRVYEGDFTLTKDGEEHELINDTHEDLEIIALVLYSK
ncbi:MAG: cupin domain-containing protein [Bacillota bacterium]|nr:cupin domain-containing protein [Bacillota bacterium]